MRSITILFGLLLMISAFGGVSAAWIEQWHFDVADFDYNQFLGHYNRWGRIHYRSSTMPVCANTIDNGVGPTGNPILEVYITGGMSHGEDGGNTSIYVEGSLYCVRGDTGAVIWHIQDPDCIYVQTKMELADVNNDGQLELYMTDYHGSMLRNAQTGALLWKITSENRRDKQTAIIRDPADGIVYVYDREMYGYMYKRIAATGAWTGIKTAEVGYPCFGGSAVGDMNNDGTPEIIEGSGGTYCFDLNLNKIWQDTTVMGGNTGAVPVLADVNNDGWLDIIIMSASYYNCRIGVLDGQASWNNRFGVGNGNAIWLKPMTYTGHSGHNAPAVYDIDNDGNLEAAFSAKLESSYNPGCVWDLVTMQLEPWHPDLTDQWGNTFANVWGDLNYLEILGGTSHNVWNYLGTLVSNTGSNRHGSTPYLVADVDGDGINEAISDGSNTYTVPGSPFNPDTGDVWSWGWNICYDTGATALNSRQEVLSQLFNTRRTGAELPLCPYWWTENSTPPPPPSTLTITSPNGDEHWQKGNEYAITWTSTNVTGNLDIELYKGPTIATIIETNTTNDGNTLWMIPPSITPASDYRIRIKNANGTTFDFSDHCFNIIASPNPPTINGPASGKTGTSYDYTFVTIDPENDDIFYEINWGDGVVDDWYGPCESNEIITRSHHWTKSGTYTIQARAKDTHGAESTWETLTVTMPCSYKLPLQWFWERIFERYPNAFPILRHLLRY